MLSYSFADLLHIFFRLHQDLEQRKTQEELANQLGVSRRTLAGWFAGDYGPRSADAVLRLAKLLSLTPFQTDLLLYAVDPSWVKYGTPAKLLETTELVRYRETNVTTASAPVEVVPTLDQIKAAWHEHFVDTFASNYNRWGVGNKANGMCQLERSIERQRYILTLQNQYHDDVFMGGDSNCFAPPIYCLSVKAQMVQGETKDDGYGIMFEEINDECFALFRVRERMYRASVVQTVDGGNHYSIYANRVPALSLQPGACNELTLLAIHDQHWFYINQAIVAHCTIARLPHSRLDVAIVAGSGQRVCAHFQQFRVYTPS